MAKVTNIEEVKPGNLVQILGSNNVNPIEGKKTFTISAGFWIVTTDKLLLVNIHSGQCFRCAPETAVNVIEEVRVKILASEIV